MDTREITKDDIPVTVIVKSGSKAYSQTEKGPTGSPNSTGKVKLVKEVPEEHHRLTLSNMESTTDLLRSENCGKTASTGLHDIPGNSSQLNGCC